MNILLIIPNLSFGGAQTSFSKLSTYLARKHRVINVVFNKDGFADLPMGGKLLDLSVPASSSLSGKIKYFFSRVAKVRRIKKEYSIDVAISFLEGADYVNVLSFAGERIIVSVRGSKLHDQNIRGWLGWIRSKILIPELYNRADAIIVLSKGIKKELQEVYKIRTPIKPIYNGFDLPIIDALATTPLPKEEEVIFQKPVIISHGRLAIEKGYQFLLKTFIKRDELNDFHLLLIGDGEYKHPLIQICKEWELSYWVENEMQPLHGQYQVYFLSYRKNPFQYLSRARIFVLPSLHEGFGNSLVEAMACGIPVVASDCPYGPREILGEGLRNSAPEAKDGILVRPWPASWSEDIGREWSEKLFMLHSNSELYEYYRSRSLARAADFAFDAIHVEWLRTIEDQFKQK